MTDAKTEGCPVAHDSVTAHGSESENPAIDSPTPKNGGRPRTNRDWWPNQLDLSVLHAHAPVAEITTWAGEQLRSGRSVKVDVLVVGEHELHQSQRVARTRPLADA